MIILLYSLLQGFFFQEAGPVGEVAIGWSGPPNVIIQTHPTKYDHGEKWGPLRARQTRPTETIKIRQTEIPIAINSYTSAVPDWPSFLLHKIIPSPPFIRLFHVAIGGGLILLCIPMFGPSMSIFMGLLLATDWTFLFYKHLLGGTELCLQFASMGIMWVLWKKKSWGWLILWTAVGLQAKITFSFVLIPVVITIFVFRISLPTNGIRKALGASLILCTPLMLHACHHHTLGGIVPSHDTWVMQWNRVVQALSGSAEEAVREQGNNLWLWMTNPLHFYERIYNLPSSWVWLSYIRKTGWFLCAGICFLHRKDRNIQVFSLLLFLVSASISLGPKDLHHFAMITPIWSLWVTIIAKQSKKWIFVPFVLGGILTCIHTDHTLAQITVPTFNASQQEKLVKMLEEEKVETLITMDYEIYGLLEYLNTDIDIHHGWGAISHRRYRALPDLLTQAENGHLIVLSSSMPMRYNLKPTIPMIKEAAQKKGLRIEVQRKNAQWVLVRVYRSATDEL